MTPPSFVESEVASIVMAAGRGSRMKGYGGNKTLLPLVPGASSLEGSHPVLLHLLDRLPAGPKALVVHHCKQDVMAATRHLSPVFCEQPELNGTGGAILAAKAFVDAQPCSRVIITMGDVPFVRRETYARLIGLLESNDMAVLGFSPADKRQYGVLEIENGKVCRITEWKYWKDYPADKRQGLSICNSGIYAVTRETLMRYLPVLSSRPQVVHKEVDGRWSTIEEFFITDLVEALVDDGRPVGYWVSESETETMGIDDLDCLQKAQRMYAETMAAK